ncbi:MAG: glycosyltransferase family 4 protein [Pirellulaceae bacterium]
MSVGSLNRNGILLVGNFPSSTSVIRNVCEDLAPRLRSAGWNVFTTSHQNGRLARFLDSISVIWQMRKQYRIASVDVFSGNAFYLAESSCTLLRSIGKPYVLTLRGGNLPAFARTRQKRVAKLLQSAAAVVAPSGYLQNEMRNYCEDIQLIPNPLSTCDHPFRCREHAMPRLIWVRSFHEVYNPTMAPQIVSLLVKKYPEIQLIMAGADRGDGSLLRTRKIAEKLDVTNRVFLPGRIPNHQVPEWLNQADIFLNTTNADNTPVSVMEAMACGLCVTSTNVGGLSYLLEHERDALLVKPNDANAMATAVDRILSSPILACELSRNGRRKAEQLDWSCVLPQWNSLLQRI